MSAIVINIDTSLTNVPTIEVGKQGENGATQVVFDVSEMIETYGSGTAYVVVQRRGDAEPYLLDNTSQSGDKVTWTVSNVDTDVYGTGRVQLFWLINEQVAKTVTYQFYVEEALHDPQDAPVVPGGWISDEIGNLDNLTTTAKANLVAAINEVNSKAATNTTAIGTLANLTTTEKSNLVGAINEVNEDVSDVKEELGDLSDLETTDKSDLVSAINEAAQSGGGVQGIGIDTIVALTQEEYDAIEHKSDTTLYIITDGEGGGGTLPSYSVTNDLTYVSTNNTATSVLYGNTYTATLTPDENYFIDSVTVTMGGADITSTVYANGVVSIPSVTGNIVITAVGDTTLVSYPYLQSDGTAFITLDEAANSTDIAIEVATAHVDKTTDTTNYAILGAGTETVFLFDDKQWINFSLLGVRAAYKETDRTTRHVYKSTPTALYRDGVSVVTRNAGTRTKETKISVFTMTGSGKVNAYVKIYNVKIYNGETLIADYTPMEHEGVPCLYDSVGDKYAYNSAGAGALIYGEELGDA